MISASPVHIENKTGGLSPSAFIPFCEFGGNMTLLGKANKHFSWPVCDKFKPTVHAGRLCYSLDLESLEEDIEIRKGPSNGLTFVMDYNEERMVKEENKLKVKKGKKGLYEMHHSAGYSSEALIFLDTLGMLDFLE